MEQPEPTQQNQNTFSVETYTAPSRPRGVKLIFLVLLGVVAIGLVGYASWWGYGRLYTNKPDVVIAKSIQAMSGFKSLSFDSLTTVEWPHSLNSGEPSMDMFGGFLNLDIQKIQLRVEGGFDRADKEQVKSRVKVALGAGSAFGSFDVEATQLDTEFYLRINQIPVFLASFVDPTKVTGQWIKFDAGEDLESQFMSRYELEKDKAQAEKIATLLKQELYTIFIIKTNHGVEDLNGTKTNHYSIGLSRSEIEALITKIKGISTDHPSVERALGDIDESDWKQIEKQTYEVWIDREDFSVRRLEFQSSFPNPLEAARTRARDAKRISDIKQIQTALELYYSDNNAYPVVPTQVVLGTGDYRILCTNGFPKNQSTCGQQSMYMTIPTNPQPGGADYTYQSTDGKNYRITFSLDASAGNLMAGTLLATSSGIQQITTVPDKPDDGGEDSQNDIIVHFTLLMSGFNEPITIEIPQNAIDTKTFMNTITGGFRQTGSTPGSVENPRDAKRISDIKQIQTALELYYSDNNAYPVVPTQVVLGTGDYRILCTNGFPKNQSTCGQQSMYMTIPTNPQPGGADYTYQSTDGKNYQLMFSLEEDYKGIRAGKHVADSSGIQQDAVDTQVAPTGTDSDGDGLSDVDELNRWFSDPRNPDSDGDGYPDGTEVANGYDPMRVGAKLNQQ